MREALRQEIIDDWRVLIDAGFVMIKTKDMRLIPLVPNAVQTRYINHIHARLAAGLPVRIMVPKARQHGISTATEAIIYSITAFRENVNAIIVADMREHATTIFEMSKLIHDQMDASFKTTTKKSNANELSFLENHSKMVISTDARSGTFHIFHSSETAFYTHADTTMLGVLQTVPSDMPGTIVIMESTGNGVENYFHRMVKEALRGDNEYEVFFIAWWENPDYSRPAPADFTPVNSEAMGDEISLQKEFNLTNQQLAWRRYAIKNLCGNDLHKFMQEYPATVEECFQGSGYPVFNHANIAKIDAIGTTPPNAHAWIEGDDIHIEPQATGANGYIHIWEKPVPEPWRHRYVIGADTGGTYDGADYCSAYVYDRVTRKVVALIHGHFDAYVFAHHLVCLGTWYQKARLAIEVNRWASETDDLGNAVIDNIKKLYKYNNFYTRKVIDKIDNTESTQMGWWTDHSTKQLIVDRMRQFVDNWASDPIGYHDGELLNEMLTYIVDRTKTGITTWNAAEGCKDDRVMSFGITLCVSEKMPPPELIIEYTTNDDAGYDLLEAI